MSERKVPMFAEHGLLEETLTGWSYSGHNGLDTDSLSDRLVNPDEYEPLIPAVNQQAAGNFQLQLKQEYHHWTVMALLVIDTVIKDGVLRTVWDMFIGYIEPY